LPIHVLILILSFAIILAGAEMFTPARELTFAQVLGGVIAILIGPNAFVDRIALFSHRANLNPGVLSLILSPLATELPEKYNSVV
jgi:cation:H+ antiporter